MTAQTLSIPRATHGLVMLAATVLAIAGAGAAAWSMAGPSAAQTVAIALLLGSMATAAPVVMKIGADYWGVSVLFSGAARALLVLAACYLMKPVGSAPSRPVFLPAAGALAFLLAVETISTIRVLAALERKKAEAKSGTVHSSPGRFTKA